MRFIGAHELLAEVASKDAQEAKSGSKIRSHAPFASITSGAS